MGKACVRFKKLDDLALDVIAEAIQRVSAKSYIAHCEAVVSRTKKRPTKGAGGPSDRADFAQSREIEGRLEKVQGMQNEGGWRSQRCTFPPPLCKGGREVVTHTSASRFLHERARAATA